LDRFSIIVASSYSIHKKSYCFVFKYNELVSAFYLITFFELTKDLLSLYSHIGGTRQEGCILIFGQLSQCLYHGSGHKYLRTYERDSGINSFLFYSLYYSYRERIIVWYDNNSIKI